MEQFDVAIVGAGPTGLACGIELKRRGISTVLFDKGCVVNSIYHYPINLVFFTTPELLEIGDIPMTSLNEKPGRTEALKYYRRVADHYQLNVHQYEKVLGIEGDEGTSWFARRQAGMNSIATERRKLFSPRAITIFQTVCTFRGKNSPRCFTITKKHTRFTTMMF